ncbi:MAG: hypothetical protein WC686_05315 [Candidatus Shapirobacteria bacterium]|jgi:hypothetical protein
MVRNTQEASPSKVRKVVDPSRYGRKNLPAVEALFGILSASLLPADAKGRFLAKVIDRTLKNKQSNR